MILVICSLNINSLIAEPRKTELMKYLRFLDWPDIIVLVDTRTSIKSSYGNPNFYDIFESHSNENS
uniref:Uncharacterized protein n=1 Tax=Lepeophtheirus salmonis TaxID=72036 RepID=A0A0K2U8K0_LEPSM